MTAPVLGPCVAWVTGAEVAACCSDADAAALAPFAVSASQILYELSGLRFNGGCDRTERPCAIGCGCWMNGPIITTPYGASSIPLTWGWWTGRWGWGWGGCDEPCGCGYLSEILLNYPVGEVTEVKVDGIVVAPASYRVDDYRWLVRTDGTPWPACQNLALPSSQVGTFEVTYTFGVAPPAAGKQAAIQLACQLYSNCANLTCKIPDGAVRVTRQGVEYDRRMLKQWNQGGFWSSGLTAVDVFLNAYNPGRLTRPAGVWSPDRPRRGRRVGT